MSRVACVTLALLASCAPDRDPIRHVVALPPETTTPTSTVAVPPVAHATVPRGSRARVRPRPPTPPGPEASTRCGGSLPSCSVLRCENRSGDITAENPRSSASGKWQVVRGTWGGYGGYAEAKDAPEEVQDAHARELWDGGRGASHWASCL